MSHPPSFRPAPADVPPPPSGLAIFLLALATFAGACAFRIGDPILPRLVADFSVTTSDAALIVTAFGAAYGVAQFFYGPLSDRIGKIRTVTAATMLCSVGSLGAAFAPSLDVLVLCRVLSGAAGAGIMPIALAWLGDNVPYERRQALLARFLVGSVTGIAGGHLIGGVFADTLGWRYGFAFLGTIYLVVGLTLLLFHPAGKTETRRTGQPGFVACIRILLSTPWPRRVLLMGFFEGAVVIGVLALVPNYLQARFGISSTMAGMTGVLMTVGGYVYIITARWLVPVLGERGLVVSGGLMLCATFLLFLLAPSWQLALTAGLSYGLGYYLLHATVQTHATQMAPAARGTAVSIFASFLFAGQALGVSGVSYLDATLGMPWVFGLAALLMLLATYAFHWAMGRRGAVPGQLS
jgi:predicted MFS family arabinose efflux permease